MTLEEGLAGEADRAAIELPHAVVVLHLERGSVAVDAQQVQRVIERTPVTPLPRAPAHIGGLVLVGARAVPLFDIEVFMGLSGKTPEAESGTARMVVCEAGGYEVVMVIVGMTMVLGGEGLAQRVPQLTPGPQTERYCLAELEWEGRSVLLLDLAAMLEAARARG